MISKDKTTLFFSKNTDAQTMEDIKLSLNVPVIQHYEKYLGLPSFVGREKKKLALPILRKGFGQKCKGRRRSFCPRLVSHDKSGGTIYPYLFNECVQITRWLM